MEINTLTIEILEQIFENITYERKCVQRANFRQIALVCKRWSAIIILMIWKEMEITGSLRIEKSIAFSFYRHCHTRPLTLSLVRFILYVSATRSQDVNWNPEPFSL